MKPRLIRMICYPRKKILQMSWPEEGRRCPCGGGDEAGRTTDPVRMYMREMGTVELLTREGEIAIAKRIEEAFVTCSQLASYPGTVEYLLETYAEVVKEEKLADLLVGY